MSNLYVKEFHQLLVNRYSVDSSGMLNSEWLSKNTTLKGKPFSFKKYPFQRALVDDDHTDSVTIKPSQVGVSEVYQRVSCALLARHRDRKGIYAYPDDDMRKKNVQTRVMPMVSTTPIFNKPGQDKPVRSIQLLQINQSFLYMTGSKEGDATSTDADFVFLDEYDLHDMDIATLFSSRLLNSDWKIKRYFSTPTFTQYGVHALYENSDQMEYQIKCDGCNRWQFPMFTQKFIHLPNLPDVESLTEIDQHMLDYYKIDLEESYVCCENCRKPLDLGRENNRAWVAKYPSRAYARGRRVNPFSCSTRPPKDIVLELVSGKKKGVTLRRFNNTILGEAEDSSNARIPEAQISACIGSIMIPQINRYLPTWIGIDMGHTCHLMVAQGGDINGLHGILLEEVPLGRIVERVKEVCNVYNVIGGLVDRHPQSQVADDIRDATQGRVLPCEYRGEKEINIIKDPLGNVLYIQANRTILLDKVPRAIRNQSLQYNGYGTLGGAIPTHLRNMVRDEEPGTPAVWRKLDQADHIFHASGFMLTAVVYADLARGLSSEQRGHIGIAGVDMAGYNETKLIGSYAPTTGNSGNSTIWLPPARQLIG